jgi:hypothetical protein
MPFFKRFKMKPDLIGPYYYINKNGSISKATANNNDKDLVRYNKLNFFRSFEEAYSEYGRTRPKTNTIP